uniref:Uncharacterized protein n=1 Tax=Panagrellus redivivus TaxID=6233 RepID=A0A7E4VT55_PANRE
MGECVNSPGYLKFMRCDTDWCNTGCKILEPTTATEIEITTEQTTFSTTREEITTRQTSKVLETSTMFASGQNKSSSTSSHNANEAEEKVTRSSAFARSTTVQTPTGKRASTTTSVTISQTTGTCSKDSELDSRKPEANNDQNGEIQGIRTFGKGQMGNNHSYRPNNCNCRCEHKREQNTFVVINNAASFNIVTTFVTAFVYLF